ncbi:MAG: hypothetical protein AAF939_22085 [Planctomycetota bacterium]
MRILSPKLSACWLRWITPETAAIGRAIIDGLRNPTLVRSQSAKQLFDIVPISTTQAIQQAIDPPVHVTFSVLNAQNPSVA